MEENAVEIIFAQPLKMAGDGFGLEGGIHFGGRPIGEREAGGK